MGLGMHRSFTAQCPAAVWRTLAALLLGGALLIGEGTFSGPATEESASAQTAGFTIQVFDYTSRWQNHLEIGVQRWDAALASRGIRLQYVRQDPVACEVLSQPAYGISVCDFAGKGPDGWVSDGEHQGIWA